MATLLGDAFDHLREYERDLRAHHLCQLVGMLRRGEVSNASRLADRILDQHFPGRWASRSTPC